MFAALRKWHDRHQRRRRSKGSTRALLGQRIAVEALERRELLSAAPLTWFPSTNLPTARGGVDAVEAANLSTLILGGPTSDVPNFGAADPAWLTIMRAASQLDQSAASPGVGTLTGGQILIFGGKNGDDGVQNTAVEYDYSNFDNPTQSLANMHTPRYLLGFATDENNHVYAIGGIDDLGQVLSSVEWYDQSNNAWNTVAPLPKALDALSAVADGA
ncbi:MAG TPA: kelch repeat-containing protein, partial [Pirellulales bacterium]|nr:kelch repeat-containing protein [Pirellulales bacterium]